MRKQPQIEAAYWLDSFPIDLAISLAWAAPAALISGTVAYFSSQHYLARAHTLDPAQHHAASLFLALFLTLAAAFITTVLVLLFRYFRRLYRNPL